jgi:protein required for attachment to host cells
MQGLRIPHNACVMVGDGEKALFLRNEGDEVFPNLEVDRALTQENPPTHEQGSDRPGRMAESATGRRSALEETDWHRLEKERFAKDIADRLYRRAHSGRFDHLVIVAPPKTLGDLCGELHAEVKSRLLAEVPKDLTGHPIDRIEEILTRGNA